MCGNWHAQFMIKKKKKKFHGDWHVSVQNMCFVKLQGHRSSVQRIRPWSIRYWEYLSNINNLACSHTYSSNSKQNNISWYKMCVLYVWLKSFIDHKNNRQKFGHTFLAEKKKNNLVLKTSMLLFLSFKSKTVNDCLCLQSSHTKQCSTSTLTGKTKKNKKNTFIKPYSPPDLVYEPWQLKKVHRYTDCS